VTGRNIDDVFEARDTLGTDALAGGLEAATRRWNGTPGDIPNFDLEVRAGSGARIWVNVSTIVFDPLSAQDCRILELFASGANAAAIARKLRISAQTLRNHLHRINRKLRTHSRLEAVTHARRRGLID
jgi:DNA-binding CsgD family transcriptional regulator